MPRLLLGNQKTPTLFYILSIAGRLHSSIVERKQTVPDQQVPELGQPGGCLLSWNDTTAAAVGALFRSMVCTQVSSRRNGLSPPHSIDMPTLAGERHRTVVTALSVAVPLQSREWRGRLAHDTQQKPFDRTLVGRLPPSSPDHFKRSKSHDDQDGGGVGN